jgi:hypothetical protein
VSDVARDLESIRGRWHGTPPEAQHVVSDEQEVNALVAQMAERRDWVGPPLVMDGEVALNGTNALAAARRVKRDHGLYGSGFTIPTIDVDDLCERFGLDWEQLQDRALAAHGSGTGYFMAVVDLATELPDEVGEYLGLK